MKTILIATIAIFFNLQAAQAQSVFDNYIGTTWELDAGTHTVTAKFYSTEDREFANGLRAELNFSGHKIEFNRIEYVTPYPEADDNWIHGGQSFFSFYSETDFGDPAAGLFIASEDCLLLPDSEAPEDCLRLVE